MSVRVIHGDCLLELPKLVAAGEQFHACVTDPPYHLTSIVKRFGKEGSAPAQFGKDGAFARAAAGFMGKIWDGGDVAFRPETWRLVFEALLPGAHLVCFGGTRTHHRLACAIEDAGFEIRDSILDIISSDARVQAFMATLSAEQQGAFAEIINGLGFQGQLAWIHGQGFNKQGYISYQLEAKLCVRRDDKWFYPDGQEMQREPPFRHPDANTVWGQAGGLKPAFEPIILARKPLDGTVAANVLKHRTGALNIDASRITVGVDDANHRGPSVPYSDVFRPLPGGTSNGRPDNNLNQDKGRWPANCLHDRSEEVLAAFAKYGESRSGTNCVKRETGAGHQANAFGKESRPSGTPMITYGDVGSVSRFFWSSKAGASDRAGSSHPTVKPTDLIRYLIRLVCPPGGTVLDPFAGTGSTGLAADQLGFNAVLIEQDATYCEDARRKISSDAPLFAEVAAE